MKILNEAASKTENRLRQSGAQDSGQNSQSQSQKSIKGRVPFVDVKTVSSMAFTLTMMNTFIVKSVELTRLAIQKARSDESHKIAMWLLWKVYF